MHRLMRSQDERQVLNILKEPSLDYRKKGEALNSCDIPVMKHIQQEICEDDDEINFKAIMAMTYFSQSLLD